uniref:Uncharacterized protein n=1 Tax=Globodera rostochiensis TaxID=31243 RepID=A0A914H5S2_GLORO
MIASDRSLSSSSIPLLCFFLTLLHLCLPAQLPSSQPQWRCPNNGTYFDATPCDPNATYSCPALYKCRMALESDGVQNKIGEMRPGQRVRWICCEIGGMGIREWLLELGLAPAVFPKVPKATLRRVFVRDEQSAKVIAVDGNGADISLLPFDNSESANYIRLEGIEFDTEVPKNGGFLHILVAINRSTHLPLDLGAQNDRFPRGYAQAIGSGFVPASLAYRRQHVLAVFHTVVPMANLSEDIDRSMAASDGKLQQAMFGSSDGKGMANLLGATPIAGFIYTVTTRASIFPLTYAQQWTNSVLSGGGGPTPSTAAAASEMALTSQSPGAISPSPGSQLEYNAGGQWDWFPYNYRQDNAIICTFLLLISNC